MKSENELCWGEKTSENGYQPCTTCPIGKRYFDFIMGKGKADKRCFPKLKRRGLWKGNKPDRSFYEENGPIVGNE